MEGKKIIYLNQPCGHLGPVNAKINVINPLLCEISGFKKQNYLYESVHKHIKCQFGMIQVLKRHDQINNMP